MNGPKERIRTSDADQSPERIEDPRVGLDRLKEALKRILKVPKEAIEKNGDTAKPKRST